MYVLLTFHGRFKSSSENWVNELDISEIANESKTKLHNNSMYSYFCLVVEIAEKSPILYD